MQENETAASRASDHAVVNWRLCYVDGAFAYFTSQELDKQWGDDWNDAPYEHNAGCPYGPRDGEDFEICQIAWEADLETPCDGVCNSRYSVEMINKGLIPWLATGSWAKLPIAINAGVSVDEFTALVEKAGGTVYLPKSN